MEVYEIFDPFSNEGFSQIVDDVHYSKKNTVFIKKSEVGNQKTVNSK